MWRRGITVKSLYSWSPSFSEQKSGCEKCIYHPKKMFWFHSRVDIGNDQGKQLARPPPPPIWGRLQPDNLFIMFDEKVMSRAISMFGAPGTNELFGGP